MRAPASIDKRNERWEAFDISRLRPDVGDMNNLTASSDTRQRTSDPGESKDHGDALRHALAVHACATARKSPSFAKPQTPNLASQMRVAFSSMVWNTGCSSPGELEMTRSTSEVAVCCSSASASSLRQLGRVRASPNSACGRTRALAFVRRRTKLATARSALRPLARQGHLVGTVTGPRPGGPS